MKTHDSSQSDKHSSIKRARNRRRELEARVKEQADELSEPTRDFLHESRLLEETEKALRETEQRWHLAIQGANLGVWDWDLKTGATVYNERWVRMLGYSPDEIPPHSDSWKNLMHPDDVPKVLDLVNRHFAKETPFYQAEFRMKAKSGHWHWVRSCGAVTERDMDSTPLRMSGIHMDIDGEKRSQELLKESEARYRSLVENMSNCVAIYKSVNDGADFVIVDFNRAAELSEKVQRGHIIGKSVKDVFPGVVEFGLFDVFQRVWQTGRAEHHPVSRYEDERIQGWRENFVYKLPAGEIVALYTDETERKRSEQALRESEERYRRIVETANEGVWSRDEDYKTTFVNARMAEILGYESHEMIGRTVHSFMFEQDLPEEQARARERQKGTSGVYERRFIHKLGHEVWTLVSATPVIDEQGEFKGSFAMVTDISDRRKVEEALRKSESLLTNIIEQSPFSMWISDAQGTLQRINPACKKWTRVTDEEVVGKYNVLKDEAVQSQGLMPLVQSVYENGQTANFELTWDSTLVKHIEHTGTAKLMLDVTIFPVKDEKGTITNAVCQHIDITDRKTAEDEVRKLNAELEQRVRQRTRELEVANKDLEAFAYTVSHDLRAPLRAIAGFSQIIARRHQASLNEEGRRYVDNIVKAAGQMDRLITDLLSYSRLGRKAVNWEPVRLRDVLAQVIDHLSERVTSTEAELLFSGEMPIINGDRILLSRIITNLLDNALTYHGEDVSPRIQMSIETDPDFVILSVADNGIGIAPEYQQKIFNIFQRLHSQERYPGTGIGLAVAKRSTEMLGGSVWVESKVGEGSTFFVKLPVKMTHVNT